MNSEKILKKLQGYMQSRGLNAHKIAIEIGYSHPTLNKYFKGTSDFSNMGLGNFVAICECLSVDPCEVLGTAKNDSEIEQRIRELSGEVNSQKEIIMGLRAELRGRAISQGQELERLRNINNSLKRQILILTGKRVKEVVR